MKHLALVALSVALLAVPLEQSVAQEAPSPTVSSSPTPTAAPQSTPISLTDVVTQADAAEASLQVMQPASDAAGTTTVGRDLSEVTREINAQQAETRQLLQPGVLLETLRDLEGRWVKLGEQLALWTRSLTTRANLIDKQIALLPDCNRPG